MINTLQTICSHKESAAANSWRNKYQETWWNHCKSLGASTPWTKQSTVCINNATPAYGVKPHVLIMIVLLYTWVLPSSVYLQFLQNPLTPQNRGCISDTPIYLYCLTMMEKSEWCSHSSKDSFTLEATCYYTSLLWLTLISVIAAALQRTGTSRYLVAIETSPV